MALLAGDGPVHQGGQADVLVAGLVEELEVLAGRLLLLEGDVYLAIALAINGDGMAGTVDVLHTVPRLDDRLDGELLGSLLLERIDVLNEAGFLIGHGGEAQSHLLVPIGRDGEDAEAE